MEHKQDVGNVEPVFSGDEAREAAEKGVTFFHDFVAGGVAGSASVVVGHPFDTMKVRLQASSGTVKSILAEYGVGSLFRGMLPPLSTACIVNAMIFSTYGYSSRVYDTYFDTSETTNNPVHDSAKKAFVCGSVAGFFQALVICPVEHVKCRLQIQHGKGTPDNIYKGPSQATRSILSRYGISGMYRGFWVTSWREVPAFGFYFALYDFAKDRINSLIARFTGVDEKTAISGFANPSHAWMASALAGGITGASTWAMIYPFDIIKTKIQTAPLDTPLEKRRILTVAREIVQNHGIGHLFRGLNVTVIRAFPVNAIIFPIYEYVLLHVSKLEHD